MSGYLEVKYPFKSNLGLNPFKSWKRQWCILRPSPTFSGGVLAVYCSEAGASAGTVELPSGFVVRRTKSRSRPHAFAVYPTEEPRKPRVLLAANSPHDAQVWIDKIKALIDGNKLLETEGPIGESYSVTITSTELSRKCGLSADSSVSITPKGLVISQKGVFIPWSCITDASLNTENGDNGTCILTVNSDFGLGSGELRLKSPLAPALCVAVGGSLGRGLRPSHLSKSDGHLNKNKCCETQQGKVRRSSCCGGPSEVSLDDLDLVMSKDCGGGGIRRLSRCSGAGDLADTPAATVQAPSLGADSMCDRRSVVSIESGIYEEIPDAPADKQTARSHGNVDQVDGLPMKSVCEPTYECVVECVRAYATMRHRHPPPLPPRDNYTVTRHGSLGWLPPAPTHAKTLPRWDRSRQAFSAFRKRLKSDSRATTSPKSETSKEKDVETKKKKFDFPPTRDLFKSFKVSKKMKNLKIGGNLSKGETKSCEFLDEANRVTSEADRCSKSVENIDADDFLDGYADLSLEYDRSLTLPQEIVDLILKGRDTFTQISLSSISAIPYATEGENMYMPMSPIVPQLEHDYIAMSPRTNIA